MRTAPGSEWSEPGTVEAGLLEPGDWQAMAVGAGWEEDPASDERRPPLLRREFAVRGDVASAPLYVTAHGLYEVEINGRRVGDDAMSPGWTTYNHRLRYYTYDVTGQLAPARTLGSWLGDGWYRGRSAGHGGFQNLYGDELSLLAQLEVRYSDGSVEVIGTDDSWRAAPSPIVRSGNYDGEMYDARRAAHGWTRSGFDDAGWHPSSALTAIPRRSWPRKDRRCAAPGVEPAAVLTTPAGRKLLDFGQNLVGRLRIRVSGEAGGLSPHRPRGSAPGRRAVHPAPAQGGLHRQNTLAGGRTETGSRGSPSRLPLRGGSGWPAI